MWRFQFIVLCLFGGLKFPLIDAQEKIVGGTETSISNVPYLVSLRRNGRLFCGGSLVTLEYVVTAAHCVDQISQSTITVHAGTTRISENGEARSVSNVKISPAWSRETRNSDVAVLKLSSPLPSNNPNIKTIKLNNQRLKVGVRLRISGWGTQQDGGTTTSDVVRTVIVPTRNKQFCQNQYSNIRPLTQTMFCAGRAGKDSCAGDSGGPAVCPNGNLCGITSWGYGCGRRGYPGVYTAVRAVRTFIENAIQ